MCLILSKDRNNATFAFSQQTGVEKPLHESEYRDIAPDAERNCD